MKFIPHQRLFDQVKNWRTFSDWMLAFSTLLAIIGTVLDAYAIASELLLNWINAFNALLIATYILGDIGSSYFQFKADSQRRLDLIDNSFDTNFSGRKSQGYFSNSTLTPGLYKLAVNCYENTLFSYNISRRMVPWIALKNIAIVSVFILAAALGEKKMIVLIFELSLPVVLLQQLIRLWVFKQNNEKLLEEFQSLFEDLKNADPSTKYSQIIRNVTYYESNVSWASLSLSSKIFNQINDELSNEWELIKKEYKISN